MTRKQIYAILGIKEGASLAEVKKAYRKKAFELHPDLSPSHDAGRRFQELNEAYVLMLGFLEEDRAVGVRSAGRPAGADKKDSSAAHSAQPGAAGTSGPGRPPESESRGAGSGRPQKTDFQSASASSTEPGNPKTETRKPSGSPYSFFDSTNNNMHLSKEEVLSNVLRDPFARRVFEDIYREIRHGKKAPGNTPLENLQGFADIPPLRAGRKALYFIKDWFRRQIDDEQTVTVPVNALRPGMRIRLQVQHGMSGKKQNIEVTLPLDYTPGRPVRLRGLGRKIGPWLGDLYLRIVPKTI